MYLWFSSLGEYNLHLLPTTEVMPFWCLHGHKFQEQVTRPAYHKSLLLQKKKSSVKNHPLIEEQCHHYNPNFRCCHHHHHWKIDRDLHPCFIINTFIPTSEQSLIYPLNISIFVQQRGVGKKKLKERLRAIFHLTLHYWGWNHMKWTAESKGRC